MKSQVNRELKLKINAVFRALRAKGYIARQSFMCCSSCAGEAMAHILLEVYSNKQSLPRGAVFFNRQDADHLEKTGELMIRFGKIYGYVGEEVVVTTKLDTKNVGREIMELLTGAGIPANWPDNSPERCIVADLRNVPKG